MNDQTATESFTTGTDNLRIQVLLEKLRDKLNNLAVMDRLGYKVGQVKDVKLDNARQLNLLILEDEPYQNFRYLLVRSSQIQQIDTANKLLTLHLSKTEIHNLPEYVVPKVAAQENSDISTLTAEKSAPTVMEENRIIKEHETDMAEVSLTPSTVTQTEETLLEEVIRLLEEKLVVNLTTRKVGEVIVRKEIETRMVEVPVRREKLIVEQVSPEQKQLAEIDLGIAEISGIELKEVTTSEAQSQPTVSGEFTSLKTASLLLGAIAAERNHKCKKVRVEIILEDEAVQKTYQEWFNRCQGNKQN